MPDVGVRDLKTHASEIVRAVRDRRARYTITYRGRPIGMLVPLPVSGAPAGDDDEVWEDLLRLGEEIGRGWQSPLTSVELLSEMRR
ncbi:MAG TPA: type II toxin-antitoxin system prevent-host-death family antitoxin [Dehalococcoidia bacterium]|nr:type II toxin-antitoxin system prevent-host-death family antitoxin [Dehalococcoidia bacterium]